MILRVLNLILIVITFGLVEIIDTVTYDEIDNNITVTGYEDYTYREVFGDSLYGIGKTNLIDNGDFSDNSYLYFSIEMIYDITNGNLDLTNETTGTSVWKSNDFISGDIGDIYYRSIDVIKAVVLDPMSFRIENTNYIALTNIGFYSSVYETTIITNNVSLVTYSIYAGNWIFDNLVVFNLTTIFEEENEPTIEQFGEMKTEYERLSALQPYEQVTTTRNTLDMTDLIISLVSLLCWYGIIKVWKGVRK